MTKTPRRATLGAICAMLALVACAHPAHAQATPPSPRYESALNTSATANADILSAAAALDVSGSTGSRMTTFQVTISLVSTGSVLDLAATKSGTTLVTKLNGGTALTAGIEYTITFLGVAGTTYNLRLETSTTIGKLLICEVPTMVARAGSASGGGSSSFVGTATSDLDMDNFGVVDADRIQFNDGEGTSVYVDAPVGDGMTLHAGVVTISGVTSATLSRQANLWLTASTTKTLTDVDCKGTVWSTKGASGAIVFALPSPGNVGDRVSFYNGGTGTLKITSADEIRMLHGSAAEPAYIYTSRRDSWVTLDCVASGSWTAVEATGTWSVNSTSSAGFAYTPTAWVSYTPTIGGWTSGVGTAAGKYRQSGNVLDVQIMLPATGAVTGAGAQPTFDLPSGFSGDTASEPSGATIAALGVAEFYDQSAGLIYGGIVYPTDADTVKCAIASTGASPTSTTPMTWANNDQLSLRFSRPVQ